MSAPKGERLALEDGESRLAPLKQQRAPCKQLPSRMCSGEY